MLSTSLKPDRQILSYPPVWIPRPIMWENYGKALVAQPFLVFIRNTLAIAGLSGVGALLSNSLIAYGFSRLEWKGRDVVFLLVLSTVMLPYQVVMIPLFVLFSRLGWAGTWRPLIAPAFLGNPFFIFLLRQFMLGIPRDLTDAAQIDGASDLVQLTRIILPLCRPALATVALFQFIWSWNDFVRPLIYLSDKLTYPISLGLALYRSSLGMTQFSVMMAAAAMAVAPIIVLFFFTQRTFIQGITFSGLKG
jgi:multiple sugar transport system permease protein